MIRYLSCPYAAVQCQICRLILRARTLSPQSLNERAGVQRKHSNKMTSYHEDHDIDDGPTATKKKTDHDASVRDFMSVSRSGASSGEGSEVSEAALLSYVSIPIHAVYSFQVDEDGRHRMFSQLRGSSDPSNLASSLVSSFLSTSHSHTSPASEKFVSSLPAIDIPPDEKSSDCGICLNPLPSVVRGLPCRHLFHAGCIVSWLKVKNSCPQCRREFPKEEEKKRVVVEEDEEDDSMYG